MSLPLDTFEAIYDAYGALLHSIALDILPSRREADEATTRTFVKIYTQPLARRSLLCIELIRLLLTTAHELYPGSVSTAIPAGKMRQTPLIYRIIYERFDTDEYGAQNNLTYKQVRKMLHEEVFLIREAYDIERNAAALVRHIERHYQHPGSANS
jgi:hypothetical protein